MQINKAKNQTPDRMRLQTRIMLDSVVNLVLVLFLFSSSFHCEACNQLEQESLLSFNFITSSPPLNWSSAIECCLWEGIDCDADGRVTHVQLPWRGLGGTLSPSIGNLTHLSTLNLSHNHLSGTLPDGSFPFLILLETLDLSYNSFSGEFPSSLSSIHIKFVDLSSNQFYGMIPSSFFQLAGNLVSFNVSNNSFTGLIPLSAWIDSSCSVRILDFSYNKFNGQIPPGLGNCSKLQIFRAGYNNLSGSLPDDIYGATSLEEISLPLNYLSGAINNGIVGLTSLTILELYSNQLTGLIPHDIGKLTNLKILLLHINNLSGFLPPSMKNCINLIKLNLRYNHFEGHLSEFNFSTLLRLRTLDLGNNNFTGSLPSTFTSCKSLTALRLSGNKLEGQISPETVALESLTYLSIADNKLTNASGAIKALMGCKKTRILILCNNFNGEAIPDFDDKTLSDAFQNLEVLALSESQFHGKVPAWIGKLRNLQVLDLSLNQLTGSIPGWLGTMPSLFYIDFSSNFISGEFPKELGGLLMLTSRQAGNIVSRNYLDLPLFFPPNFRAYNQQYNKLLNLPPALFLGNNSLRGSIPVEIGQLKFLHLLDLSRNNFSGKIPNQMSQLTNLERLDLSGNNLSGEIPASLSGLNFLSSFSVAHNNLQGLVPSGGQFHTFPISSFEGNPGLCGDIVQRSCTIQPRTTGLALPISEPSNQELVHGLIAGVVFGLVIGSITGILYPTNKFKFLQNSRSMVYAIEMWSDYWTKTQKFNLGWSSLSKNKI